MTHFNVKVAERSVKLQTLFTDKYIEIYHLSPTATSQMKGSFLYHQRHLEVTAAKSVDMAN